ncbi:MAG: DUF2304 domain-containing protein [Coriobacteriaceae bacterium]|nr:DUF2304 domain-containing protein [Coriobacteriaceae bacterium]
MSGTLRFFLLSGALLTLFLSVRRLRRAQLQTLDSIPWLCVACLFVVTAIFPQIAFAASALFGFESPSNFVFLAVITLLLVQNFSATIRISELQRKVDSLSQEIAIRTSHLNRRSSAPAAPDDRKL